MADLTILHGVLLVILGVAGYLLTGRTSMTALIPAAFGLLFVLCGAVARQERYRKHAMHIAAALGLMGFLGTGSALRDIAFQYLVYYIDPEVFQFEYTPAMVSKAIMAAFCLLFLLICIRSFIKARRAARAAA